MFISKPEPSTKIWVAGASGNCQAAGVGTIKFSITTNNGSKHLITLYNVIYLPQCAKNLICILKWSEDRKDDTEILSRRSYSIFLWDNDNRQNFISHPSHCKIPLMTANEKANKDAI
mmetsp:Transcript_43713/g.52392  ORF Transcript_43713/g.52392 Transcript_43713/m.52392 type:complete len:117 (+) Transcript_43713:2610-2960(+)